MDKNSLKVIIIDDEPLVADSVECFLEDRDWNVVVAESGEIALDMIKDMSIKVAIVDIRLGGMSGEQFIRKAYDVRDELKFIICTGSPNYMMDDRLHEIPTLYGEIFKKPVNDLTVLEKAILEQLETQ